MPTRLTRHRAARSRRRRRLLGVALGLAAVGAAAFLLAGHSLDRYLASRLGPASARTAQTAAILRATTPCPSAAATATRSVTPDPATTGSPTTGSPTPGPATTAPPGGPAPAPASPAAAAAGTSLPPLTACPGTPARVSLTPPRKAAGHRKRPPGTGRTSAPGPPAPSSPAITAAVQQVLTLINQTRIQDGFAPYTLSSGLVRSAAAHTALMAAGCGLSHQCPGEPPLGARETAAGVRWTAAGENIAEGGPEPATAAAIAAMATTLTQDMLNEHAPGDGHRRNLLSPTFRRIGIAIVRDRNGTIWLTQDFSS